MNIFNFCANHANYGDLLYPIVLQRLLPNHEVARLDILGGKSPMMTSDTLTPVQSMFDSEQYVNDALFIGGGAILRCNKESTAMSHKPRYYELFPNEQVLNDEQFVSMFMEKYFSYPSTGPWMLEIEAANVKDVVYFSAGAGATLPRSPVDQIAGAFNEASFIYVRDNITKYQLSQLGVKNKIHAAPDSVVVLSDLFPKDEEIEKGRKILKDAGVDINKKILVFQSLPLSNEDSYIVAEALAVLQDSGFEIVMLPIGLCHDDDKYLQALSDFYQNIKKKKCTVIDVTSVNEIISVIAACNMFLGTSMHGCITAYSYGIPFIIGATGRAKMQGFLEICGLRREFELTHWMYTVPLVQYAYNYNRMYLTNSLEKAKASVYKVTENILAEIT